MTPAATRRAADTERKRKSRARLDCGRRIYDVEAHEHRLAEALIASGRCTEAEALQDDKVEAAMAEIIEAGRTGEHFTAGDGADLATTVESLFADRVRLAAMRRACRDEYEQKYTAEQNYQLLLGIYRQALNVRHGELPQPANIQSLELGG